MIVGFTGTRFGMTEIQAAVLEGLLPKMDEFHHGSCQGADVQAARLVRRLFVDPVKIVCHPGPLDDSRQEASGVDDVVLFEKSHFARNRAIVDVCDALYATPCNEEDPGRGGTWYTINYARKNNKAVTIVTPSGAIK